MILPIILAGGAGERLWPLSRELYPKQFLALSSTNSLLQDSLLRLPQDPTSIAPALIVCQEEHRFLVAEQLRQKNIATSGIILEPMLKNTALAISVAAIWAQRLPQADPLLLVMPADHALEDHAAFQQTIVDATVLAEQGLLVTFGVTPTYAETGYGYITKGAAIAGSAGFKVAAFLEKPNASTAGALIAANTTLWNSGMFMFKCSSFLAELQLYQTAIYETAMQAVDNYQQDLDFIRLTKKFYQQAASISVDHAIMERTTQAAVVPLTAQWCDIGNWHALWQHRAKDPDNNVIFGEPITLDTNNCLIDARENLVATIGVHNLIITATKDAILIADQSKAQQVKDVVHLLKQRDPKLTHQPSKVARPWGWFESLAIEARFQVKRIMIDVGKSLSLQLHHHRSEHWVVVKGTARITKGEEVFLLTENQSTYIPLGTKHRLENIGALALEIIEIQSGSYLGEDDIVRLEDNYGRATTTEPTYG